MTPFKTIRMRDDRAGNAGFFSNHVLWGMPATQGGQGETMASPWGRKNESGMNASRAHPKDYVSCRHPVMPHSLRALAGRIASRGLGGDGTTAQRGVGPPGNTSREDAVG